jgi:hypothetical protein
MNLFTVDQIKDAHEQKEPEDRNCVFTWLGLDLVVSKEFWKENEKELIENGARLKERE